MTPEQMLAKAQEVVEHQAEARDWYRITAEASGEKRRAKAYIYDVIGGWFGLDTPRFVQELSELDVDELELHINSPGGNAFDGVAIRNALRQHQATVIVHVDGLAASAASAIAMAGDEVIMATGSQMMIHDGSGICLGQAADMIKMAEILDKISDGYADIYAARAGGKSGEWRERMKTETWYSASEAVDAGLADKIDSTTEAEEDVAAKFDLSIFTYAGRDKAPAPATPGRDNLHRAGVPAAAMSAVLTGAQAIASASNPSTQEPPAEPAETTTPKKEGSDMSDTLRSGLRERLGISADADLDDDGLMAALDETLAEHADPSAPPAGTQLVDESTLAELRASAEQGRAAREQQIADHRVALVKAAIEDGRVAPARRDEWLATLENDPGAEATLAGLAKGLVPLAPKGFTGGVEDSTDDDRIFAAAWGDEKKGA